MHRQLQQDQGTSQLAVLLQVLTGSTQSVQRNGVCMAGNLVVCHKKPVPLPEMSSACGTIAIWISYKYLCLHPYVPLASSKVFLCRENSCSFLWAIRAPSGSHAYLTHTVVLQLTLLQSSTSSPGLLLQLLFTSAVWMQVPYKPAEIIPLPSAALPLYSLWQPYCVSASQGRHSCGTFADSSICYNLFLCPSLCHCRVIFLPSFAGRLRMQFQVAAKLI